MVGGQIVLSLGLHPEHLASLRVVLQGSLGMVLGSAIIASGMVGLAEGYEQVAGRLHRLLGNKQISDELEIPVRSGADLTLQNRGFWKSYQKSTLALCIFLAGTLGLTVILTGTSFRMYTVALGLGIALFGLFALGLGSAALRHMRRTHQTVQHSTHTLQEQPDISAEPPVSRSPQPATGWVLRRNRNSSSSQLEFSRRAARAAVKRD